MKRRQTKLERGLYRRMLQALREYHLISEGDRVMVCLSGGKDSYALLYLLELLRQRAPFKFELIGVHLDQAQPGYDGEPLRRYLEDHHYPHRMLRHDTYSIVKEKTLPGQAYCFMCSRLRRGILYQAAVELGCTKIALGHHRDDALETLMLNLVYSGQLKSMPPKLVSDDGRNVVIRPLIYCAEADLAGFAEEQQFPILPCNLCGSQADLKRGKMKEILAQLEALAPGARSYMLAGLTNVRPSHLLDRGLWARLGMEELSGPAAEVPGSPDARHANAREPEFRRSEPIETAAGLEGRSLTQLEHDPLSPRWPLAGRLAPEEFDVGFETPSEADVGAQDPDQDEAGELELDLSPRPVFFHDALGLLD